MGEDGISPGASDQLSRRFVVEVLVLGFDSRRPTILVPPMTPCEVSEDAWALSVLTQGFWNNCNVCEGEM